MTGNTKYYAFDLGIKYLQASCGAGIFSHKTDMVSTMQISHIRLTLESTILSALRPVKSHLQNLQDRSA